MVSGWLGKSTFRIIAFLNSCIDAVVRSAINPPSGGAFAAYVAAAKGLGSNEPALVRSRTSQTFPVLTP